LPLRVKHQDLDVIDIEKKKKKKMETNKKVQKFKITIKNISEEYKEEKVTIGSQIAKRKKQQKMLNCFSIRNMKIYNIIECDEYKYLYETTTRRLRIFFFFFF
jgi:hypothetical protein